jgi:2-dehydropantoate 2-reductase
MVRADQVEALLPQLSASSAVKFFAFMHNRAAGSAALGRVMGRNRFLLGFPGAGGTRDGNTILYRMISEQPTTLGEPDGAISERMEAVARLFAEAGFTVILSRHMEDWLKTHALFVTAVAGAIYRANGSAAALASCSDDVRVMVHGIRQGFEALSVAGVMIEPRKLAWLFALPAVIPEFYWRRFLARPAAELIFAGHSRAAPGEMWTLVKELREIIPPDASTRPELEMLWTAVAAAANLRACSLKA